MYCSHELTKNIMIFLCIRFKTHQGVFEWRMFLASRGIAPEKQTKAPLLHQNHGKYMYNYGKRSHDEGDISTPFLRLSVDVFLFKYLTHCYFARLMWRYVITLWLIPSGSSITNLTFCCILHCVFNNETGSWICPNCGHWYSYMTRAGYIDSVFIVP